MPATAAAAATSQHTSAAQSHTATRMNPQTAGGPAHSGTVGVRHAASATTAVPPQQGLVRSRGPTVAAAAACRTPCVVRHVVCDISRMEAAGVAVPRRADSQRQEGAQGGDGGGGGVAGRHRSWRGGGYGERVRRCWSSSCGFMQARGTQLLQCHFMLLAVQYVAGDGNLGAVCRFVSLLPTCVRCTTSCG